MRECDSRRMFCLRAFGTQSSTQFLTIFPVFIFFRWFENREQNMEKRLPLALHKTKKAKISKIENDLYLRMWNARRSRLNVKQSPNKQAQHQLFEIISQCGMCFSSLHFSQPLRIIVCRRIKRIRLTLTRLLFISFQSHWNDLELTCECAWKCAIIFFFSRALNFILDLFCEFIYRVVVAFKTRRRIKILHLFVIRQDAQFKWIVVVVFAGVIAIYANAYFGRIKHISKQIFSIQTTIIQRMCAVDASSSTETVIFYRFITFM